MNTHSLGNLASLQLAQVVDNRDPEGRGRVKIVLLATELEIWSSAVVASAGKGYGFSCLPRIGETVVLAFVTPDMPLVLGSIWAGSGSVPGEAEVQDDHYVVKTPAGTLMEFDDADGPKLEIRSPQGHSVTVTDSGGGEIELKRGDQIVKLSSSEIRISSSGKVRIDAGSLEISAGMVRVESGTSRFSGVVQADSAIASTVVGTSYTPGAGNIW